MRSASRTGRHYSVDDYFAVEAMSPDVRHEYLDGEIVAMAGGSFDHARLSANTLRALASALGRECAVVGSDLRIHAPSGLYTYADVAVVCGPPELLPNRTDTLTNPSLVVEVLSPSTRDYDQGQKLDHYRSIPALRHVVFVDTEDIDVIVWSRTPEGWEPRRGSDRADAMVVLDVELSLAAIYDGFTASSA